MFIYMIVICLFIRLLYVLSFLSILSAKIQLIMHSTAQAATKIETNRKTMDFQKDSFWLAKGVVLMSKRTRFGMQKDPFWSAKGVLFEMYSFKPQFQPLSSRTERGKN